jgi:tRNA-splicing ligase RtcB
MQSDKELNFDIKVTLDDEKRNKFAGSEFGCFEFSLLLDCELRGYELQDDNSEPEDQSISKSTKFVHCYTFIKDKRNAAWKVTVTIRIPDLKFWNGSESVNIVSGNENKQFNDYEYALRYIEDKLDEFEARTDMIEIKGKVNTAICYTSVIEDNAIEQIREMCDCEFTAGSRIRIMPDVHAGKGCTIGTTMTVKDKVVPNVVGVDIGCGMYTVNLGKGDIDFAAVDEAAHFIPSGRDVWEGRQERFDLTGLHCYRDLKDSRKLERSLGTLGGGNHFIEIDRASDGTNYLVIHSGSRNLGKQVAEWYQKLALDLNRGMGEYFEKRDRLIREYKAAGRRKELQPVLKELIAQYNTRQPTMPKDLCFLYGKYLEDYLHDVEICQCFAKRNRESMAEILLDRTHMTGTNAFHTIHNYIDTQEMILRKGAIAAHKGEKVLIPINMRDGSVLAVGRGNPEWNYSAPHGAGRLLSRTDAKKMLDMNEYREEMKGIYTTSVNESTLDEAPMAYKSLNDIIDVIRESVDVIDIMKPIYNFKASSFRYNSRNVKGESLEENPAD